MLAAGVILGWAAAPRRSGPRVQHRVQLLARVQGEMFPIL